MKQLTQLIFISFLVLALGACTTTPDATPVDTSAQDAEAAARAAAERERLAAIERARLAEEQRIAALLANTTILFDYDQDTFRSEYTEMLQLHADRMVKENRTVVLEGHADERGTPEYNLALGERRAQTIAKLLRTFGVSSNQIQVVSFGEESPASSGHNESDWAQNRRVVLNYK